MVERLNYYANTRQLQATRDELLDVLVAIFDAALFGRDAVGNRHVAMIWE